MKEFEVIERDPQLEYNRMADYYNKLTGCITNNLQIDELSVKIAKLELQEKRKVKDKMLSGIEAARNTTQAIQADRFCDEVEDFINSKFV